MAVLEEKSIYVDVERLYLLVKVQIPYYEAVLSSWLSDSDANYVFVTACSHFYNESLYFFLRNVDW